MHARDGRDGHFTLGGARLALFLGGALITAAIFGAALQRY
ncbi:MAG: M23 family peptidase, partial [Achromobacter sp.]|nr:M23 family peptidase [Achromobacter sp.]